MNKRNRESGKKRGQNSSIAIPRNSVPTGPNPITFAGQLNAATGHRPASAPHSRLYVRLCALFIRGIQRLSGQFLKRRRSRRKLELLEIQQLGEKRFVAIVRVGKQKFLIGGAATSISLLAEITAQRATVITPRQLAQESA
jgi:hypothetical protein